MFQKNSAVFCRRHVASAISCIRRSCRMKTVMTSCFRVFICTQITVDRLGTIKKASGTAVISYQLVACLVITHSDHVCQKTLYCRIVFKLSLLDLIKSGCHNKCLDRTRRIHLLIIQIDHSPTLKIFDINRPGSAISVQHLTQFLFETVQFHIFLCAFVSFKIHITSIWKFLTAGNGSICLKIIAPSPAILISFPVRAKKVFLASYLDPSSFAVKTSVLSAKIKGSLEFPACDHSVYFMKMPAFTKPASFVKHIIPTA